eukprot:11447521-Alexandrium_andersonii.AAC.1
MREPVGRLLSARPSDRMYCPRPTALARSVTFGGRRPSTLALSTSQSAVAPTSAAAADRGPCPRQSAS